MLVALFPDDAVQVVPFNRVVDPAVLQDHVLGPLLDVENPADDPRLAVVPGSVSLADLAVRAGGCVLVHV